MAGPWTICWKCLWASLWLGHKCKHSGLGLCAVNGIGGPSSGFLRTRQQSGSICSFAQACRVRGDVQLFVSQQDSRDVGIRSIMMHDGEKRAKLVRYRTSPKRIQDGLDCTRGRSLAVRQTGNSSTGALPAHHHNTTKTHHHASSPSLYLLQVGEVTVALCHPQGTISIPQASLY